MTFWRKGHKPRVKMFEVDFGVKIRVLICRDLDLLAAAAWCGIDRTASHRGGTCRLLEVIRERSISLSRTGSRVFPTTLSWR